MSDYLVEIESKDLPKLQKFYSSKESKSCIAFTTIANYINWFEQESNIKHVKFYCLNGDFSDGTFALVVRFLDRNSLKIEEKIVKKIHFQDRWIAYVDTLSDSHENLTHLLHLLDYSKGLWFFSERIELQSTICDALKQKGVEIDPNDPVWHADLYRLRCEDALKLEIT